MNRKALRMEQLANQPKPRKRRKPMTAEQKKAAAERLAKARAAKKKTGSAPKNVHPSVVAKDDSDMFSLKNVREWIKHNKELLTEERRGLRANVKGAQAKVSVLEGYVRHMEHYIRTGDWIDTHYGKEQGQKVKMKCVAMAYHFEGPMKGMAKRDVGVTYPDVGLWTQEMHDDYYGTELPEQKAKYKRKKTTRASNGKRSSISKKK